MGISVWKRNISGVMRSLTTQVDSRTAGLSVERPRGLPEVDRAAARADVTAVRPWDFHASGKR
jgi:hypothetical protein